MEDQDREFISAIAKDVVTVVAPEELKRFEKWSRQFFANPTPPANEPGRDKPLEFGMEGLIAVTPAALAMVSAVVVFLKAEISNSVKTASSEFIQQKIKGLFEHAGEGKSPEHHRLALTAEQLAVIDRCARAEGKRFGVDDETAKKMARALVGSLALK